MNNSAQPGWWLTHLWALALGVAVTALIAVIDASSILALGAASFCAVIIRASFSRLAREYIAHIVVDPVVAPRFAVIPNVNLDRPQLLASPWILAVCLGGVVSGQAICSSPRFRPAIYGQRITPAVFIAILSLLVEYALVAGGSFGVDGQYARGDSSGGYLALVVQIGPASAAGAHLSTLGRPTRTMPDLLVPAARVALQTFALTFSGFRGAAPLDVLAVALCSFRRAASKLRMPFGRRIIVGRTLICFVGALFLRWASVREGAATAAGFAAPNVSLSNVLPIKVQRLDESIYLTVADESRDIPAVEKAVSLSNQLRTIVPRFLYPSKGTTDYGPQRPIAVYGAPSKTVASSEIEPLGDAMVNFAYPADWS